MNAAFRGLVGESGSGIPEALYTFQDCADPIQAFRAFQAEQEQMRGLAPLPDQAQRVIDQALLEVALSRLSVVRDVMAAGLTYNLPNWLSVLSLDWERQGRAGNAIQTMEPTAQEENQLLQRTLEHLPIFCTLDRFSFGPRLMAAAARAGYPIDTAHVQQSVRNINEKIENQAINGISFKAKGYDAPGLLNAPHHATFHYGSGEAWDAAGGAHTGEEIVDDVQAGVAALQANHMYGPYHLWVPTSYGIRLNDDFKANSDLTILARLKQLEYEGPLAVSVADFLPANTTVLCQMTRNVLDVVVGQQPAVISWLDSAGMVRSFLNLACVILRVKSDSDNQSGIAVGTPS